jgi:hypothetical protein
VPEVGIGTPHVSPKLPPQGARLKVHMLMLSFFAVFFFHPRREHSVTAQANFEKDLFAKTSRTNARGERKIKVCLMSLLPVMCHSFAAFFQNQMSIFICLDQQCLKTHLNAFFSSAQFHAAEIIMFDDVVVVYKFVSDLMFFAVAQAEENEVVLSQVLTAMCDAIGLLLRGAVEKKSCLENLDLVLLAMDELVEGG